MPGASMVQCTFKKIISKRLVPTSFNLAVPELKLKEILQHALIQSSFKFSINRKLLTCRQYFANYRVASSVHRKKMLLSLMVYVQDVLDDISDVLCVCSNC